MWFDTLPANRTWASLWYDYIICQTCGAIRKTGGTCPACQAPMPPVSERVVLSNGEERIIPRAFMGAEGRYEDYLYLDLLEREWKRPVVDAQPADPRQTTQPPSRSAIILVFWTYFETRIDRLLRRSMHALPPAIADDLLRRYASIGSRVDKLYRVLFSTTYWSDLQAAGYQSTAKLLQEVHRRRNDFAHGTPSAIDDALIARLVAGLKEEHEGWIAVFNKRVPQPRP